MRYHVVVYVVPDPTSTKEIPFIDEEFNGPDSETVATAMMVFIEENTVSG